MGFGKQLYNLKCEYFEVIENYSIENTEIKVKNISLIYLEETEGVFMYIERSKETILIEDYIATMSQLRRYGEKFVAEVLMSSGILSYRFMNLNLYDKIRLVQQEEIIIL